MLQKLPWYPGPGPQAGTGAGPEAGDCIPGFIQECVRVQIPSSGSGPVPLAPAFGSLGLQ